MRCMLFKHRLYIFHFALLWLSLPFLKLHCVLLERGTLCPAHMNGPYDMGMVWHVRHDPMNQKQKEEEEK